MLWTARVACVACVSSAALCVHEIRADFFLDIRDENYSANETMRQCETAVDGGRYAELWEYEASERRLSLPANDEAC